MTMTSSQKTAPPRDRLTLAGWLTFLLLGGVLVFGFAASLGPAAAKLEDAACRPMSPEARDLPAPDFELVDLAGRKRSFSEFDGKFVVLNFWATWCEPCTREWPDLARLAERLEGRDDVVVLAVSLDEDHDEVRRFLKRMVLEDSQVVVLRDPTGAANKLFGSEKLPDTFFVDETRTVTHAFINVRPWGRPAALRCVGSRVGRAS